ncbi:MAG: prolyl oligopeptidase family serine peptidase [Luteitalea sp.]|nr:prolyl oligopeptidase family serine peptidase [Luteitalea sp.]
MTRVLMVAATLFLLAPAAIAEVRTREVEYRQGETVLQGLIAWDDAMDGKRPGVLVVHEWWGHNEHTRNQAKRLAEAGYVGFALDMYGKGKVATHPKDAEAFMKATMQDPATIPERFNVALEQLQQDPHVDADRIAAIGYCFGGGVVLGMARAGADLDAVVSFHGTLGTETPVEKGKIKGQILALHGEADSMVPPEQVEAFRKEMTAAGVDFELVSYPGAKHGFTNPDAGSYGMEAIAYDADAAKKSWAAMLAFFEQVFQ